MYIHTMKQQIRLKTVTKRNQKCNQRSRQICSLFSLLAADKRKNKKKKKKKKEEMGYRKQRNDLREIVLRR